MANEYGIYVVSCTRKYGPCVDMEDAQGFVGFMCDSDGGEPKDYPIVTSEAEYQAACDKHHADLARSREAMAQA